MKVVNIVAGPGTGKSILAARIFSELKLLGKNVELVTEYAKQLTWLKDFDSLRNQYHVSSQQYKMIKNLEEVVDVVVTDGSLLHGLAYNVMDRENTSNVDKTHKAILQWHNEFDNLVIFLERSSKYPYQQAGRGQTLAEAIHTDNILKYMLFENKIEFISFPADDMINNIEELVETINEFIVKD
jgi:hypothetical protein